MPILVFFRCLSMGGKHGDQKDPRITPITNNIFVFVRVVSWIVMTDYPQITQILRTQ